MDPTMPFNDQAKSGFEFSLNELSQSGEVPTVEGLFRTQMRMVSALQAKLASSADSLSSRDFRDLLATTTNILSLAHRTDELQKTIATYKLFAATVMEFLRSRSDQLGEDLVEQLREVSRGLHTEEAIVLAERNKE